MMRLTDRVLDQLRDEIALPDLSGTKYRMIRPIAAGGMGEVYLVEDEALARQVALKVTNTALFSEELARRMLREARIVARLEHPSIVPVHDVGRLPDGRPFFTMKYVHGDSLHRHAQEKIPLPERLRTFHKICEAVAFAHAHGVLHRDLKPENIMVGPFGEVLVMDWGIAKMLRENLRFSIADFRFSIADFRLEDDSPPEPGAQSGTQPMVPPGTQPEIEPAAKLVAEPAADPATDPAMLNTAEGTVLGTLPYMSPEQAGGEVDRLDERTDIYALGAILYFMLVGRPPRDAASQGVPPPVPPRQIDRTIPRPVEAICMKAIAPSPSMRYTSAQIMAEDIIRFLDGLPVSAYRENPFEQGKRWSMKHRFVLLLILAYLVMRLVVFLSIGN